MCKQSFPILSSHLEQECEIKLLQYVSEIPQDCNKHLVQISSSLFITLNDNQWIYVVPNKEKLTILCKNQEPYDVVLENTGVITLNGKCKGYGIKTILQAKNVIESNATKKDIVPKVNITLDCCESFSPQIHLEKLSLDLPLHNVLNSANDLKLASYKINEVQQKIDDQEWKLLHSDKVTYLSWLTYVCLIIIAIAIFYCCCCKCKGFKYIKRWFDDESCCKQICIKPMFINKISQNKTSDDPIKLSSLVENLTEITEECQYTVSTRKSPSGLRKAR